MAAMLRASGLSAAAMLAMIGVAPSWAGSDYSTRWYDQAPLQGTGPGLYYSYHPDHVPGYPEQLRGYPVPIYSTGRPTWHSHAVGYQSVSAAHIAWCYDRWLSYRVRDNTYQPRHGHRKQCRSPYL